MASEARRVAPAGDAIAEARLQAYRLALCRPWVSARDRIEVRSGWLVRLRTRSGHPGLGDCAPLPSAGTEQPDAAQRRLRAALPGLIGADPGEALARLPDWRETPAARCALETALLDMLSSAARVPLARWLKADAPSEIQVGLPMGALGAVCADQLAQASAQGYRVIKLKVGLGRPAEELAALGRLAAALGPGVGLRLDANGAWQEQEARQLLCALQGLPVESIEEPLAGADPEALRRLQSLTARPLALDESLAGRDLRGLLARPPVRRLVLKPQALGGLLPSLELARRARAAGLECLVTSTLEGPVGLWAGVHLAAALDTPLAHGLATGLWLAQPEGVPLPQRGRIRVPDSPGLGPPHNSVD